MGTDKRARQKANRQAALEHTQAEDARQARRQRLVTYGGLVLVAAASIGLVLFLINRDDDEPLADEAPPVPTTLPVEPSTDPADEACPAQDGSSPLQLVFAAPPPMCIDPTLGYTASIETTEGTIVVELDAELAPITVNNFVVLSRFHYYDDVLFHRVIDDFMIQSGDAVGEPPGSGGPGYTIADELPAPDYVYAKGELAMANSSRPDTGGSQWFIVTRDDGVDWLGGGHSLFGRVSDGIEVVEAIEAVETGDGDVPVEPVRIVSVTITESPATVTDGDPTSDSTTPTAAPSG